MAASLPRPFRRLAHPRSRRSQLWACVYCGAFEGPTDPDDADSTPDSD